MADSHSWICLIKKEAKVVHEYSLRIAYAVSTQHYNTSAADNFENISSIKTLYHDEKLLNMNNFPFCHNVLKRLSAAEASENPLYVGKV